MLTVKETFNATWTNYGCEPETRTFTAGEKLAIQGKRPEGVMVQGFFLFNKYLIHCKIED